MTKRPAGRLGGPLAALIVAGMAGAVAAQPEAVEGTIEFEGGAHIPAGHIELHLRDPASDDPALGEWRL